jgi:hypothetical protein
MADTVPGAVLVTLGDVTCLKTGTVGESVGRVGQLSAAVRCEGSDADHLQKGSPAYASMGAAKWESAVAPEQRAADTVCWHALRLARHHHIYVCIYSLSLSDSRSRAACLSTL